MDTLPLEILVEIFSELSKSDLLQKKLVCKSWYQFISVDHLVWRLVCMKKWMGNCSADLYGGSWKHMVLDDNLRTKAFQWEWDCAKCGQGIHTFHNNRAAVFASSTFPACQVLCTRPCSGLERFYIEVEIVHTTRGAINVGVSRRNADAEHRCGFDNNGWSFSLFSGAMFHDQGWAPQAGGNTKSVLGTGTRIGMGINMRKRCINLFFNGINQGVFVEGIPSEVYPSVSIGDVGDCVVIIPNPAIPKF